MAVQRWADNSGNIFGGSGAAPYGSFARLAQTMTPTPAPASAAPQPGMPNYAGLGGQQIGLPGGYNPAGTFGGGTPPAQTGAGMRGQPGMARTPEMGFGGGYGAGGQQGNLGLINLLAGLFGAGGGLGAIGLGASPLANYTGYANQMMNPGGGPFANYTNFANQMMNPGGGPLADYTAYAQSLMGGPGGMRQVPLPPGLMPDTQPYSPGGMIPGGGGSIGGSIGGITGQDFYNWTPR